MRSSSFRSGVVAGSLLALTAQNCFAHTVSVGYEATGPGTVNFWYGTYHDPVGYTEGSLHLVGGSVNVTQTFTLLTNSKPAGLIDGTTNFYSNGTILVGTPVAVFNWQGVTFTGLTGGTYTFTYIPIGSPTSVWQPTNSVILSSTISLNVTGGGFIPNSNNTSVGAAGALDGLIGNASGDMANVITVLQAFNNADQHAALQHIAPETGSALGQASSQTVTGVLDSITARIDTIRSEGYAATVADDLMAGKQLMVAAEGDISNLSSGETTPRRSFWLKAFGAHADQGLKDTFAGYTANTAGIAAGADILLDNDWLVGAAFTYASTDVAMSDYRSGDGNDIDSYQLTLYAGHDFGKWYLDAMAAYAKQNFDTTRNTSLTGVAHGDFDGDQYAARIMLGWPLAIGQNLTLTPMAGLEWNHLDPDSYTETGAGPLSMHVQDVSADRLRSAVGAKLGTEKEWGGYAWRPTVTLLWRYEFLNDGIDSTSTFTGGGATFTTPGQTLERNTFNVGAQVAVSKSKRFALTVRADADFADGYTAYAGQLMGQWHF